MECGLDSGTVAQHTSCLQYLKVNAKNTGEKIDVMYSKLITGNGHPPIQQQITTIGDKLDDHIKQHEISKSDSKWGFERIVGVIAVIAMIYFGYQSMNQTIVIDKTVNIEQGR